MDILKEFFEGFLTGLIYGIVLTALIFGIIELYNIIEPYITL